MKKKITARDPEKITRAGRLGGLTTLKKRGPEFYSRISKMRKNRRGGRPAQPPVE